MAVLSMAQAITKLSTDEITPIEKALDVYLSSPARVDYFKNTAHANHVVLFQVREGDINATVNIAEASKDALKASIEAAGWKSVKVTYLADRKLLEVSFAEKEIEEEPDDDEGEEGDDTPTPPVTDPEDDETDNG